MHPAIENMINTYQCHSISDYTNALKEIIQKIALLGLWRAKFFEKTAFYGGTSLRILYGLNRYSEDLDFSLLDVDPGFSLMKYNEAIGTELQSFG
ncbi:MAG: nucleotidyl transferase AbiEii/AbiGii toxin family protein, partial [Gammaproteobacteria bacterium]|nr:nucleotidyl transferase AbiEii/AbiGii toxin family protein [Gammaproteobacteria bacterium]